MTQEQLTEDYAHQMFVKWKKVDMNRLPKGEVVGRSEKHLLVGKIEVVLNKPIIILGEEDLTPEYYIEVEELLKLPIQDEAYMLTNQIPSVYGC